MNDYLIFARNAYPQPLELLGPLRVEGETEASQAQLVEQARLQYGREGWIEMIAIPRLAIAQVIPVSNGWP
jgi:hypothetical protein